MMPWARGTGQAGHRGHAGPGKERERLTKEGAEGKESSLKVVAGEGPGCSPGNAEKGEKI